MNFLITGASFTNKGAQSLLFSTMNEIRKEYRDATIYYLPLDQINEYDTNTYRFVLIYDDKTSQDEKNTIKKIKVLLKSAVFQFRNRDLISLSSVWRKVDVVLDVSGYQLTSQQSLSSNYRLLRYIETAKKKGKLIFLLPQSFGPFKYNDKNIDSCIRETLQYPKIIFAREKQGMKDIKEKYGITKNVILSVDTVLQASAVKKENIYSIIPDSDCVQLETKDNVGIIPNTQLLNHGNIDEILSYYKAIITRLLELEKNVYVFRHSNDLPLCKKIVEKIDKTEHVFLIEQEFDCFQYSEFVKSFDYIIASRYHSIIHAYKNMIPSIILGWADKYHELAQTFHQDKYVFNIIGENVDINSLRAAIDEMERSWRKEKNVIESVMSRLNQNTCFEYCWKEIDSWKKAKP